MFIYCCCQQVIDAGHHTGGALGPWIRAGDNGLQCTLLMMILSKNDNAILHVRALCTLSTLTALLKMCRMLSDTTLYLNKLPLHTPVDGDFSDA